MLSKKTINGIYLLIFTSVILYFLLAFQIKRNDFVPLISISFLLFVCYFWMISFNYDAKQLRNLLFAAVFFRLLFLFSIPELSNDYFRFIWDGMLANRGINPFDFRPTEWPVFLGETNYNLTTVYQQLNSQDYYSVYPPVLQFVFSTCTYLSGGDLYSTVVLMKVILISAEVGTLFLIKNLLRKYKLNEKNVLWYALNPLIVFEISGNLHFEGLLIFFLLLSITLILDEKFILAAFVFSLAFAVKLWPLLFLPFLIKQIGMRKSVLFYFTFLVCTICLFFPFYNEHFIAHYFESLQLYFQTFEFNSGIHYFIRAILYPITGFNVIHYSGPIISLLVLSVILYLSFRKKQFEHPLQNWYYAFLIYIITSSIIHPWNISLLILFAVFVPNKMPIVWSFLIILSYYAYKDVIVNESYIIIAIEFLIILAVIFVERKQISVFSLLQRKN